MRTVRSLKPGDTFSLGIHPVVRLDGYNNRGTPLVTVLAGRHAGWVGIVSATAPIGPAWAIDPEYAEQDEDGQLSIGVAGEQRAIPGLAQRREHPTFDMGA